MSDKIDNRSVKLKLIKGNLSDNQPNISNETTECNDSITTKQLFTIILAFVCVMLSQIYPIFGFCFFFILGPIVFILNLLLSPSKPGGPFKVWKL